MPPRAIYGNIVADGGEDVAENAEVVGKWVIENNEINPYPSPPAYTGEGANPEGILAYNF
jgi:hypothetical protein